ncbi:hypothetical protein GCM10011594_18170 [Nakamurella endophytica]|uniref:Uncharacterized protein n=1 Tax=Nakamurella endophytica TaxID=1748367 RepID=A0A917SVZ5_9ACTN|nr:hypothetical protein GCM10011594_18170 [Nakamurella endophytica]
MRAADLTEAPAGSAATLRVGAVLSIAIPLRRAAGTGTGLGRLTPPDDRPTVAYTYVNGVHQ